MTLLLSTAAAFGILVAAVTNAGGQQTPAEAMPHPQLPPMPSMEGQPGDMGKPIGGKPIGGKPIAAAPAGPGKAAVRAPIAAARAGKAEVKKGDASTSKPRKSGR